MVSVTVTVVILAPHSLARPLKKAFSEIQLHSVQLRRGPTLGAGKSAASQGWKIEKKFPSKSYSLPSRRSCNH